MNKKYLPYGRQTICDEDIKAVIGALRSPWLTTGPVVEHFEKALAEKVGANYCVVYNSGTAALHAAYHAAGVRRGDEIITTPITFAATANAALYLGGKPVFVDIEKGSFHINSRIIEEYITPATKVLAPVDMAGMPADLDGIMDLASAYKLVVVEDACHALGATYKGRPVGSIADMSAFSFHPVKHITTGEGGAVTTNNQEYFERLKTFRNHGIVKESQMQTETGIELPDATIGSWYYEQVELGFNYRLPDINCALGLSQLKRLDEFLRRRREIAIYYNQAFNNNSELIIPENPSVVEKIKESSWHLYILKLAGEANGRNALLEKLKARGIGTQIHYIPVYLHPYYRKLGFKPGLCPLAEDYYKRAFTIPLYPSMNDVDVDRVISEIKRCF